MSKTINISSTKHGPFGLPHGLPGRMAGRLMAISAAQHRELAKVITVADGDAVCEVGFGPGVLLALLSGSHPHVHLHGADPSLLMLRQAARRLQRIGRTADLQLAAAERLPFAHDAFDVTIAVNTIVFWPDKDEGVRELRRVTRPGGAVYLAWHGGLRPSRVQRRLVLDDDQLRDIALLMRRHLGVVEHRRFAHSDLFVSAIDPM
jgi:ubiquinone/menaquinone biosynthesis C-methylase UbiE